MFRNAPTQVLSESEIEDIGAEVARFAARWDGALTSEKDFPLAGRSAWARIDALDYMLYEGIADLYVDTSKQYLRLAAVVFGSSLVDLLKFTWCTVSLGEGNVLGLRSEYNGVVVPLEATIAGQLSGEPQFECFEHLFFSIRERSGNWPRGTHFLLEVPLSEGGDDYREVWGFDVPDDIRRRVDHCCRFDQDLFVRSFGAAAYDWLNVPDWVALRHKLDQVEREFRAQWCGVFEPNSR